VQGSLRRRGFSIVVAVAALAVAGAWPCARTNAAQAVNKLRALLPR